MDNELSIIQLKLKDLLKKKKISVPELAEMLKMTKQNVYQILKSKDIHVLTLEKIAKSLGVSMNYFFDNDSSKQPEKIENGKFIIQIEFDEDRNLKMNLGSDFVEYIKK